MKPEDEDLATFLKNSLPSTEQTESACKQAWQQLRSGNISGLDLQNDQVFPASREFRWPVAMAMAAAGVLFLLVPVIAVRHLHSRPDQPLATVEGNAEDQVRTGQVVRTTGAPLTLALHDGSRIEMRSESELSLERAQDGLSIRLGKGEVIVNAATQRVGHLYVQTRDLSVSVVGTVFLVNAEEAGSRVAVIQGEVQVRQGTVSKKLLPGEQVASNPAMPSVPVIDEISWSRNALAHIALLEHAAELPQLPPPAPPRSETAVAQARPEFAVVSIKAVAPGTPYPGPIGIGCRGIDAAQRTVAAVGGLDQNLNVPQGRCVARGAQILTLVSFAYGNPRRVTGGPDWAQLGGRRRRSGANAVTFLDATLFQIEAVADNPGTATLDQLKQMLQTMLADRFKLKVHREMEEAPGFALVVGKNGPKLKAASGPEEVPGQVLDDKGRMVLRGKSTLDKLAQHLVAVGAPVVDKTGLSGIYEYEIVAPRPAPLSPLPPPPGAAAPEPGGRSGGGGFFANLSSLWSNALEEQIGLRLQPEKSVPGEIVVIDQVEKPAEN